MKITDVQLNNIYSGPLEIPYWNSSNRWTTKHLARLEIYTDEGLVGMAPAKALAEPFVENGLKEKLVGEDPLRTEYLWHKMFTGGNRKPVAKGYYILAMSYVDTALWDLKGKILKQPVWKLAGGANDKARAYAAGGYYEEGKGIRELQIEFNEYMELSFTAVKMKIGWPGLSLKKDAERVKAVREVIGPDIDLMVDANCIWDASTAIKFGRMIEQYDPYWYEEPVWPDDHKGAATVASALDVPVASGENEYTRWGFRDLIETGAAEIIQADPAICGGISEWLKIAALASANHLSISPHGDSQLGAICVAAVENGTFAEHLVKIFKNDVLESADLRGGYIYMSEKPGLGLVWKEDLIRKFKQASE